MLKRDFTAVTPNRKYVGDITYLPLADGSNLYLATVIDCCSRKLAGWAVANQSSVGKSGLEGRYGGRSSTPTTEPRADSSTGDGGPHPAVQPDPGDAVLDHDAGDALVVVGRRR